MLIFTLFSQAHPFGQSFLSAALRIGSLAVRRAVFRTLRCGGRSVAGCMGTAGEVEGR